MPARPHGGWGRGRLARPGRAVERYGPPTCATSGGPTRPATAPEAWCVERTVRHFLALERIFDEVRPESWCPRSGARRSAPPRTRSALERGTVLFLFYTIFPDPLRLYANTMHAPIVAQDELRELTPRSGRRSRVHRELHARAASRSAHYRGGRRRRSPAARLRPPRRASAHADRDNEYLRPGRSAVGRTRGARPRARSRAAAVRGARPAAVRLLPAARHRRLQDQARDPALRRSGVVIELVADALPHGIDLVLKEHPMSIGRNPLACCAGSRGRRTSAWSTVHELARADPARRGGRRDLLDGRPRGAAHGRPVLTSGSRSTRATASPSTSTRSARSPRRCRALLALPARPRAHLRFLHAAMRRCYPGKPVLVDPRTRTRARSRRRWTARRAELRHRRRAAGCPLRGRGGARCRRRRRSHGPRGTEPADPPREGDVGARRARRSCATARRSSATTTRPGDIGRLHRGQGARERPRRRPAA